MSTKEEYLKLCVNALKPLEDKRWYIGILSNLLPTDKPITDAFLVTRRSNGLFFIRDMANPVEEIISDAKPGEPIFRTNDVVKVGSDWYPGILSPITTTVGKLIFNAAAIYPSLGVKIPYINKPVKLSSLESEISALIKNDEDIKDAAKDISVSEYVDCMDRIWFFTKLANIISVAATVRTVLPPPGIKELKNKLIKENEGKLHDPVVVATISDTLAAYDKAYLKEDPNSNFILDKKGTTARRKLYHFYGETNDFVESLSSDPITSTMQDGIDVSAAVFPKYINDLRFASYSRGHSTQLAGYSYKILQRSLSGLEISPDDCGTKVGLNRFINNPAELVNRYVKADKGWKLISTKEEGAPYLGKFIQVKSPMYCIKTGNKVCYTCLGDSYKNNKNAINNIAADFSGELMSLFLKRMHTSGFSLTDIKLEDLVS